ncbi:Ribosomal protein L23/L15e core domain superfamily [Sesbania bispinosa]|nr:Ribosomal protein L23/L15e core domain superfamily [Sesbania bispinosa]
MGSRMGRRVVQFANLPIKVLMPNSFTNIQEIALKTIPSASKIEIKRVLESLYGFEVEKKAYVTLKTPLSIDPNLYPIQIIEEDKKNMNKQAKSSVVEEPQTKKTHWLDDNKEKEATQRFRSRYGSSRGRLDRTDGAAKFPWTSMKFGSSATR